MRAWRRTCRRQAYADLTSAGLHASASARELALGGKQQRTASSVSLSALQHQPASTASTAHNGEGAEGAYGSAGSGLQGGGGAAEGTLPLPPPGVCWEFPSLQAAVSYVEGVYVALAVARGVLPRPPERVSLPDVLLRHAREVRRLFWG